MTTAPECEERTLEVLASSPFSAGGSKRHGTRSKSGVTKPSLKIAGEAAFEEDDAKPAPPKKKAPAPKAAAPVPRSESPSQGSSGSGSDGEEKNRMQGLLTALLSQCPEETEGAKPKAASRKRKPSATPRGASSKKANTLIRNKNEGPPPLFLRIKASADLPQRTQWHQRDLVVRDVGRSGDGKLYLPGQMLLEAAALLHEVLL